MRQRPRLGRAIAPNAVGAATSAFLVLGLAATAGCAGPTPAPTPTLAPPAPTATSAAPPPPTVTPLAATPTPRAPVAPTNSPTGTSSNAQTLPTVEAIAAHRGAGFLTPIELDLELQQPLTDPAELRRLVDGVLALDGIASVHSDGVSIALRYDSTRVLPARIRQRLAELGHPAKAGTVVQNPGDAAD
jgi:hypothetical protein